MDFNPLLTGVGRSGSCPPHPHPIFSPPRGGCVIEAVLVLTEPEFKPKVFEFWRLMFQRRLEPLLVYSPAERCYDCGPGTGGNMGQVLHGSATTTEAVRRAIQRSEQSVRALARHGACPTRRDRPDDGAEMAKPGLFTEGPCHLTLGQNTWSGLCCKMQHF